VHGRLTAHTAVITLQRQHVAQRTLHLLPHLRLSFQQLWEVQQHIEDACGSGRWQAPGAAQCSAGGLGTGSGCQGAGRGGAFLLQPLRCLNCSLPAASESVLGWHATPARSQG
jgi:hypothetical protein